MPTPQMYEKLAAERDALRDRVDELEAVLTTIRDLLPLKNDEYARRILRLAANALEPE